MTYLIWNRRRTKSLRGFFQLGVWVFWSISELFYRNEVIVKSIFKSWVRIPSLARWWITRVHSQGIRFPEVKFEYPASTKFFPFNYASLRAHNWDLKRSLRSLDFIISHSYIHSQIQIAHFIPKKIVRPMEWMAGQSLSLFTTGSVRLALLARLTLSLRSDSHFYSTHLAIFGPRRAEMPSCTHLRSNGHQSPAPFRSRGDITITIQAWSSLRTKPTVFPSFIRVCVRLRNIFPIFPRSLSWSAALALVCLISYQLQYMDTTHNHYVQLSVLSWLDESHSGRWIYLSLLKATKVIKPSVIGWKMSIQDLHEKITHFLCNAVLDKACANLLYHW